MAERLRHWWQDIQSSFWFVPTIIVIAAVALAGILITLDAHAELPVSVAWPLIFGAGADGSRGLLTAVASSMITVAGVVFSITIVALTLTSSQYTSRVLRNFMSNRSNQVVLGVFVGIYAYCLVVLRTIRGSGEGTFVPSLAVTGGLALAFVGIAVLIFFIHHISLSIQASSIVATVAEETIAAIALLFPNDLNLDSDIATQSEPQGALGKRNWSMVAAPQTGYIESVNCSKLLEVAKKNDTIIRLERGLGEFVVKESPLVWIASNDAPDDDIKRELLTLFQIGRYRSVQVDAGYGIRQIVDIALKALSPGINDTTTATMCVDYIGAILTGLAGRDIASPCREESGKPLLMTRDATFADFTALAFDQIRVNGEKNLAVLTRQLRSLEVIGLQTPCPQRKAILWQQATLTGAAAKRAIASDRDDACVADLLVQLSGVLNA